MAKDKKARVSRSFHSSVAGLAGKDLFWQSFGVVPPGVIPSAGYHLKSPLASEKWLSKGDRGETRTSSAGREYK